MSGGTTWLVRGAAGWTHRQGNKQFDQYADTHGCSCLLIVCVCEDGRVLEGSMGWTSGQFKQE